MFLISVEEFADMVLEQNPGVFEREELLESLRNTLAAKEAGEVCEVCGRPIWAAMCAISGVRLCFCCFTGEADDSEDWEIEWGDHP